MPPATQQSAQGLYFGSAPVAAMRGPLHRGLPGLLGLLSGLLGLLCAEPRAADAQQCRLCENGTYCFDETLFVCPANSRSQPGSGNITACVCIAGHYATADHVCRPCEPGWFCPGALACATGCRSSTCPRKLSEVLGLGSPVTHLGVHQRQLGGMSLLVRALRRWPGRLQSGLCPFPHGH